MEKPKPKPCHNHFLLLTWPTQGHINPTLQFAKQILESGAQVTIATTPSPYTLKDQTTSSLHTNLHLTTFSKDINSQEESLAEVFTKNVTNGTPITCMVHTNLLGWSENVATRFHVPSILLWLQSGTVFNIYYHYFDQYHDFVQDYCEKDPSWSLEIPNWKFNLKVNDIPSYLLPSSPYSSVLPLFQRNVRKLEGHENRAVLVNTVEDIETSTLKSVDGLELIPVGPLLLSDKSFGSDLFKQRSGDEEYFAKWLDAQETASSVLYVSFGSFWGISSKVQMNELARALIEIGQPFMWVVQENCDDMTCMTELKKHGLIVPWCDQTKVLSHPSVGCFMTHCGWNSTLESISSGVPMVAFPLSSDQMTNGKLIEDVWEVGVRVKKSQEGVVKSEEIKRCFEVVMEDRRMKENIVKLKNLAIRATQEGGSSHRNFKAFLEDYGVSNG